MSESYDPQTEIEALREELYEEIASLRKDHVEFRKRMTVIEDDDTAAGGVGDSRDQAVLNTLADHDAELVTVAQLNDCYRRETDISNNRTLKRRVKQLTSGPAFENTSAMGQWRFVGAGGETDER